MINVVCAIIIKENKVLVSQRGETMKLPLKWEFPGGKLEVDEKEEDCIKREILEELNIKIVIRKRLTNCIHNYGTVKINLIPFIADYVEGDVLLAEHKQYRLLHKSELLELDWAEADLPILKELLTTEI